MSIAFIVGNGFNYLVEDIIRKIPTRDLTAKQILTKRETADSIRAITALWKKFDDAFKAFHEHFAEKGIKISDEDLIRLIYTVINLFSSMDGFEKILPKEDIAKLNTVFSGFLLNKIREIAKEFQEHENSAAYGRVRTYFPNLTTELEQMIRDKNLSKVSIFTTNYDGILDTLTTWPRGGFMFSDGFAKSGPLSTLEMVPEYTHGNKLILAHLHGSYKFSKIYGRTYKKRDGFDNEEPVMVFNNPKMKEEIVRNDNVLSEYFDLLGTCLSKYDNLVILGNSMEAEPHIKKLIARNFNRNGTSLTVCSRSPDAIAAEVKPFYSRKIHEETTRGVETEGDLINLFDRLTTI
ncbi:hypothetical protein GCM10023172_05760 [Hymenobacter ginsengisoli]|uniref:SIR2-like domain-containing protein n=1 Tax=Hymenobacter ginsengisoli TaxID=1051626 RepID=A0ABP8PYP8_9BACT|nr:MULTISPECIES: hypothetical protein [unclassified Hymenobacter]MBO2033898.1 hypothetical protein [Hymenobacter sp. BT559]